MLTAPLKLLRNVLLPRSVKFRTIPFGIASGVRMKVNFRSHAQHYFGLYERELNAAFRRLVKPGMRCFDVGACTGYDALICAKLSGGPVVSFEAVPELAAESRENFAANPSYDIRLLDAWIGDGSGPNDTTLDQAAERTFIPDFIKMDIEGAEVAGLRGATHILATRRPSFIIEVHGRDKENGCIEILKQHGYTPEIIDQRKWLRDNRPMHDVRWLAAEGAPQPTA